jgi:hypothetical protein
LTINTIKINTVALLDALEDSDMEVNARKTMYMTPEYMSKIITQRQLNENDKFKYLRTSNQNCIHGKNYEQIKFGEYFLPFRPE